MLALFISAAGLAIGGNDRATKFTNIGGVANTRHNLTQSTMGAGAGMMAFARNDYGEVCVYCHTPHGAATNVALPLWNRTTKATTYTTYDKLNTSSLTQTVSQPGANSLSCLSCHDGQTAVDSIINMPGSGRYKAGQDTVTDPAFLTSWTGDPDIEHQGLNNVGCLSCHAPGTTPAATNFQVFVVGTDLTNDHPVGIDFPASGNGTDFNTPGGTKGNARFFDSGDGRMDGGDVRLYDSKVECASCHDPHGVPSSGPGTTFKPTFLRVTNTASALCLTCHSK